MNKKFFVIITSFLLLVNYAFTFKLEAQQTNFKVSTKKIKDENKKLRFTIDVSYPVISGFKDRNIQDKFNSSAFQPVYDAVNSFKKDMQDWEAPKEFSSEFEIADTILYQSDDAISVRYDGFEFYAGAAHPLTFFYSLCYDLKKNSVIKLSDLFTGDYLKVISDYCINDLVRQKNEYTNDTDISWIQEGASPKDSNFAVFNLTYNSLLITFSVYRVATYAEGPKEVSIPYTVLSAVIKPDGCLSKFKSK
jgi:hypothetical protein